jgi:hypothetical protein
VNRISFYRQARGDGGIRSGIDVNGEEMWSLFEAGPGEADPALDWYVDVEWSGPSLPTEAEAVKALLVAQQSQVGQACSTLASRLEVGIDAEAAPFAQSFDPGMSGVTAGVFCSAVHRVSGREMGRNLQLLGSSWVTLINQLHPIPVGAA